MKTKKILAIGIVAISVCGVGLVMAQENLVKNEKIQTKGYNNNEIAKILDEHGMVQNPETGMFEVKTEGGIPEAGVSEAELKEIIEESNIKNFREPVTGKINYTKLANFTDPVTKIVGKLKERSYNDSEITEILEKHGMGWDPETGATWIGIGPTEEELKHLAPLYNPTDSETYSKSLHQANQVMEVKNDVYRGFSNYMKPGSCAVGDGETVQHVVTTHIGSGGYWTEAGVIKTSWNTNWRIFSYDNDEGTWDWHGTTGPTTYTEYYIYITDEHGASGYRYDIFIGGHWERSGHVPNLENDVNQANEIWSDTGTWTADTTRAVHKYSGLIKSDGTGTSWNEDVPTWHAPDPCHVKEYHEMDGADAWKYETWVE